MVEHMTQRWDQWRRGLARRRSLVAAVSLWMMVTIGAEPAVAHHDEGWQRYGGAESLALVSAAPNPARCGAAPNLELSFEGQGADTAGGAFTVVSSACQNMATGEVFDLEAVDSYFGGDSVTITSESFYLVPNLQTCTAANDGPVRYEVSAGTGLFAGVEGRGKYDIVINDVGCSGTAAPAFVSFRGKLR